jgi:hypothetical protein
VAVSRREVYLHQRANAAAQAAAQAKVPPVAAAEGIVCAAGVMVHMPAAPAVAVAAAGTGMSNTCGEAAAECTAVTMREERDAPAVVFAVSVTETRRKQGFRVMGGVKAQ